MTAAHGVRPARLEPVPPVDLRLLSAPLDFLEAEHYRQRIVLDHLDALASGGVEASAAAELAAGALRYMREDLPLHVADEERDLFPLLRRRAGPGDDIEFILALLASEHMRDHELSTGVVEMLDGRATPGGLKAPGLGSVVPAFAETQRRHIAWENALIVPKARHLLKPTDLARLGRAMAARRGLRLPGTRFAERLARLIHLDTA